MVGTSLAVQNHFFVPLLDVDAPDVVKGLFKAIVRLAWCAATPGELVTHCLTVCGRSNRLTFQLRCSDLPAGEHPTLEAGGSDAEPQCFVESLSNICVTILRQADDSITPAVDFIVEQLCTLSCADSSCSASLCASHCVSMHHDYDLLQIWALVLASASTVISNLLMFVEPVQRLVSLLAMLEMVVTGVLPGCW